MGPDAAARWFEYKWDEAAMATRHQVGYALYRDPFHGYKVTHYVAVDPDEVDPEPHLVHPLYGTRFGGHGIFLSASSSNVSVNGAIDSSGAVPYR